MLYLVILWKKTYPLFWTYKIMSSNLMCLSHSTESGRVPLYRWKKAQVLRRYEVACKTPRIQQTCRVMWADWRHTMEETHEHQGCYLAETSMSLYWLVGGYIHSTIIKGDHHWSPCLSFFNQQQAIRGTNSLPSQGTNLYNFTIEPLDSKPPGFHGVPTKVGWWWCERGTTLYHFGGGKPWFQQHSASV